MAHPRRTERWGSAEPHDIERGGASDDHSGAGGTMAPPGGGLADPGSQHQRTSDAEPPRETDDGRRCTEMADTLRERPEGQCPEGQCPEGPETRPVGRSDRATSHAPFLFAPGPDHPAWPDILAHWPSLAPATEPGVCIVVDGVAYPLDGARADSLRAGGNGVVAIAGAVAFEYLLRTILTD